jgi:hypothetical protein
MMTEYIVTEEQLAQNLGVNRRTIKRARQTNLKEGRDWNLVAGVIQLSKDGVNRLAESLGVEKIFENTPPVQADLGKRKQETGTEDGTGKIEISGKKPRGKNAPECPRIDAGSDLTKALIRYEPTILELTVFKFYTNRHLIGCMDSENNLLLVKVAKADNFKKGMKIPAKQIGTNLYELVGRCPRTKGRW